MTWIPSREKKSHIAIVDKLLYAKPENNDLQIIDDILIKVFQNPDKEMHRELAEFLDRWQFRLEIASIVQNATDEELNEGSEMEKSDPKGT